MTKFNEIKKYVDKSTYYYEISYAFTHMEKNEKDYTQSNFDYVANKMAQFGTDISKTELKTNLSHLYSKKSEKFNEQATELIQLLNL